ncbi:MAG: transcriptional repressor LexA, partial [Pseudomonadota bacterium]
SKSGIHRMITALVERGYIERLPHRARALEIKRLPEGFEGSNNTSSSDGNIVSYQPQSNVPYSGEEVPLYGKIAAGTPIEAIRNEIETVQIPPTMVGGSGEHYALTVDGDSMIEAGINDRDTVIIKKCDNAENGAIVVALVDGEEVTLKTLRRSGNKVILEPENPNHEPRVLDPDRVKVQGRLVGLMRTYH